MKIILAILIFMIIITCARKEVKSHKWVSVKFKSENFYNKIPNSELKWKETFDTTVFRKYLIKSK